MLSLSRGNCHEAAPSRQAFPCPRPPWRESGRNSRGQRRRARSTGGSIRPGCRLPYYVLVTQQQHSSQLPYVVLRWLLSRCCVLCVPSQLPAPRESFFFCGLHSLEGVIYCCLKIRNLVFAFFQILKNKLYLTRTTLV